MNTEPITKVIVWTGGRWVDQETGVYASNLGPPHGEPQFVEAGAGTFTSRDIEKELDAMRSLREQDGKRIADYIATIRVLTELSAHHWL